MIAVTLVRHGESTDNLKRIWAGRKDAPLSQHGMNQARAVGKYFAGLRIHAIYASPLLRAYSTAEQIQIYQLSDSMPPLVRTDLLREQHFGDAEGQPFTWSPLLSPAKTSSSSPSEEGDKGAYTPLADRQFCFPNGESSDDVARRVDNFISEFITPHVLALASLPDDGSQQPLNILVVSHGIAIAELIGAFLRRDPSHTAAPTSASWRGLVNTGWTQLTIGLKDITPETEEQSTMLQTSTSNGNTIDFGAETLENAHPSPAERAQTIDPPLHVRVTAVNQHSHLDSIVRQKGGIGSSAYDPKQSSLKDFFGGGSKI